MVWFILGIIALLVGIIWGCYQKESFPTLIGIGLCLVLIVVSLFNIVPTGYTGIISSFGRIEDVTLTAGLHVMAPWKTVITMDNREQKETYTFDAFSRDIQCTTIQMAVNYSIDKDTAMDLYKNVGTDYSKILIEPRVFETTKNTFSQYQAEELIGQRDMLSSLICDSLSKTLANVGINVNDVSIIDIDFTDAFTNAVEAKQVATQDKLRAQTEQERMTMEEEAVAKRSIISANAEAERAKIAAEADLEVVKIQAEAALYAGEKEAEMNKRISEALSAELIQYYWIKQWNGKLPTVSTDSMTPVFQMDSLLTE